MTTPPEDILGRIRELLSTSTLTTPRPAQIRAGAAIVEWFRAQDAEPAPASRAHAAAIGDLLGVPIIPDSDLDDGEWRCLDQFGELLKDGRIGKPGERIFYVRNLGFCAPRTEVA